MIKADKYYIDNLTEILENGYSDEYGEVRPLYKDGTPAYTKYITQVFEKYDISKGEFPITTLRNTAIKTGIREVLWIYQKQTSSLQDARDMGINWWDDWNIGNETIGQRYGATIKRYNLIDNLLKSLKDKPFQRRHIINMYQYKDLQESNGLYPCAYETLWSCRKVGDDMYLDLTLTQRSNDYITAGYINKIQYVALLMMVCGHLSMETEIEYKPGVFAHLIQDLHIYDRHIEAAQTILNRTPLDKQPSIKLKENKNFYDYTVDDFIIENIEGIEKLNSVLELAI